MTLENKNPYECEAYGRMHKTILSFLTLLLSGLVVSVWVYTYSSIHSIVIFLIMFLVVLTGPLIMMPHVEYLPIAPILLGAGIISALGWLFFCFNKSSPNWTVIPPIVIWVLLGAITVMWSAGASV